MKLHFFALALPFALPLATAAADHDHHGHGVAPLAAAEVSWAQGIIKKLDKAANKATIAHGPIDSVGMGAMTMEFPVRDAAGLARLKAGDKVRFQAIMAGGEIVVTRIEAAK